MKISVNDPCICGRGVAVKNCCFATVSTTPPSPKSNFSNLKCFANASNDCCKAISKEHYFTKGVMKLFGESATVQAPFFGPEGKLIRLDSLSAKMLCVRHNNALAPLDATAIRFFEFVLGRTDEKAHFFSGADLERWLLKVTCGFIAAGFGQSYSGMQIGKRAAPLWALETLFCAKPLPKEWGLMVPRKEGVTHRSTLSLQLAADDYSVHGLYVQFSFIQLIFLLSPKPNIPDHDLLHHRPEGIGYTVDDQYREVHLGWEGGGFVDLVFSKQQQNQ